VGLPHPLRRTIRLAEVPLRDRALGTSGAGIQFFRDGDKRYGHVIDPRTGWPAEGILTATAIAPTAALADALATAFYVMGTEAARRYCESHPDVGMLLVCPAENEEGVAVHVHRCEIRLLRHGIPLRDS
jgi:thiamine biosynthesis lipoprotein